MTLCESFHILFIIIDIYYYCLCSNKTRLLFYEYSRYYWIDFLRCGSFGILFLYSSKKRFNYASCMPKPYTGKYDLFDITKFDLYVIFYVKEQFLYSFIAREWKSLEPTFVGKYISFICSLNERNVYMRVYMRDHITFVPRYIFHCFTFPSYLLS